MSNSWIRHLLPVLVVVAAAGCASTPVQPAAPVKPATVATAVTAAAPATAAADSDIQCHNEKLTGSRLSTRVCLSRAQREARAAEAQAQRDKMSLPSAISCGQANQMGCPH
jgi:Skp family chaperone for outer membrane proteins